LGLLGGSRRRAMERLQIVWSKGRYLSWSLRAQTCSTASDHAAALRVNEWLYALPRSVCLYHRALICDRGRGRGLGLDQLVGITASRPAGFWPNATSIGPSCWPVRDRAGGASAGTAARHAARRTAATELEGPLEAFGGIHDRIGASPAAAVAPRRANP
jgi:hypothetical protein